LSTQAAGTLNSSNISNGSSADEVVAIALSNSSSSTVWKGDGCAAFVWGVANLAGLPFFDLEDKTVNNDPKTVQDTDYRVPHSAGIKSGTANTAGDGWYVVSRSPSVADLASELQPGDVVRVYKAGNTNEDSIDGNGKAAAHSFIVVSNSGGEIEVIDNWTPGVISRHSLSVITDSWAPDGQFAAAFVSRIDSQWVAANVQNNLKGNAFGDWSALAISQDAPIVTANSLTVAAGESVSLSSIFSINGSGITQYRVWFSWPDGGAPALGTLLYRDGTAVPLDQPVELTINDFSRHHIHGLRNARY
jgi:hypothetical protein